MLSAVLRSKKAIDTSIQIINAFVAMRHFLAQNTQLFQRVDRLEKKEIYHIGASLKDLGKKWFAFSKLDKESLKLLENLDKQTVLSKNF
ncbi:MAG: hypothetical protein KKA51_00235 [Nanoarchaeota archaeon]|nr:hypothetical protein [Nanoarchaeota archaeon]